MVRQQMRRLRINVTAIVTQLSTETPLPRSPQRVAGIMKFTENHQSDVNFAPVRFDIFWLETPEEFVKS